MDTRVLLIDAQQLTRKSLCALTHGQDGMEVIADVSDGQVDCREAAQLSHRDRKVLQLLVEGGSAREIASVLHASLRTVDSHRERIMGKLNVGSVAGLTKCAVRMGLTVVES